METSEKSERAVKRRASERKIGGREEPESAHYPTPSRKIKSFFVSKCAVWECFTCWALFSLRARSQQPRSKGSLSFFEKEPWLRLFMWNCVPINCSAGVGPPLLKFCRVDYEILSGVGRKILLQSGAGVSELRANCFAFG